MSHLLTVLYENRPIAWIDSGGNFTCKNKRLMVKALREQGKFWLAIHESLESLRDSGGTDTPVTRHKG